MESRLINYNDIYCGWLYFPMETRVINRIRRHLLSLAIFSHMESLCNKSVLEDIYCRWLYFPMETRVINRIRRHLLSLDIFSHGKSCNKSY